ncbi:MAG TPA: VWA domain-containing protein [Thermoanaerobaculia bacterium]|nr:VWA domain-containing protein [Thermoanaerobaculia bacterium]
MTFRSVTLLWLVAVVPFLLLFFVARERIRTRLARRFVAEPLRGLSSPLRFLRPWLLGIALLAAIVALAGPYAGFTLIPVTAREANRVIVMDVSNSMSAEDVGTTRLAAAKAIAKRLSDAQPGRVGLVVFEGIPEVVSPLTSDGDAVNALIDTLVPGEVGQPGSDIGSAVLAALRLIEADPSQKGDIVLISDGEEQGVRVPDAVARAKAFGVNVSTIVIGSAEGASIPTPDGPLRDESGQVVTTFARAEVLQNLARSTGGTLFENPFAEHALDPLLVRANAGSTRETEIRVPIDRYQWPLGVAFALLLLASLLHRGAE